MYGTWVQYFTVGWLAAVPIVVFTITLYLNYKVSMVPGFSILLLVGKP
jgi:hypothetical protein